MTVPTIRFREEYEGTGTVGPFAYNFPILATSNLLVVKISPSNVETPLTLTTHYTVTGARTIAGGNVTLKAVLPVGWKLTITRNLTLTQDMDLRNLGRFFPEIFEDALDKITMIIQQHQDELDRCIKAPVGTQGFLGTLPSLVVGSIPMVNADKSGFEWLSSYPGTGGDLPVYADNDAALAAGLPAGARYRNLEGTIMVVFVLDEPVITVSVTPSTTSLLSGASVTLTASVSGTSTKTVVWDVDGIVGGDSTVGTVTTGGTYQAPGVSGTHIVTATSTEDPSKGASCTITTLVNVTVRISPSIGLYIYEGETQQYTATVTGTSNTTLVWDVDGVTNGNSTTGTLTGTGASRIYTAPATAGGHVVTITSVADPTKSASASITAVSVAAASVSISPSTTQAITEGETQVFTATVSGLANTATTWDVDGVANGNATVGVLTGSGLSRTYTAPAATGNTTSLTREDSANDTLNTKSVTLSVVEDGQIIVFVHATTTMGATSIADDAAGGSNDYKEIGSGLTNYGGSTVKAFYCEKAKTTDATLTVTATNGAATSWIEVISYSGGDQTSALIEDFAIKTEGTVGTAHTSGLVDTAVDGCTIVTCFTEQSVGTTYTGGVNGFDTIYSGSAEIYEDKTVDAGNEHYGSATSDPAARVSSFIIALRPASTGSGDNHLVKVTSVEDPTKDASCAVVVEAVVPPPPPPPPSETGIAGFGSQTTGGAGNATVHVTNLNDSGAGSFRAALGSNRIIVFDVGGTINLTSADIRLSGVQNLTIDGTDAPSPGVTFTGRGMWFNYESNNIIVRNIRHRGGYDAGPETGPCINFNWGGSNVLLDKCSFSGFSDSGVNLWGDRDRVTIQDCICGPGMYPTSHNFPVLISEECYDVTLYHTLIYGGQYRSPAIGWADNDNPNYPQAAPGLVCDMVNNLIYKFQDYGTTIYWGGKANCIGNYYWSDSGGDAWEIGSLGESYNSGNYSANGTNIDAEGTEGTAFPVDAYAQITPTSASAARAYIIANAGCRVGGLDAYDQDIIDDITH